MTGSGIAAAIGLWAVPKVVVYAPSHRLSPGAKRHAIRSDGSPPDAGG